MRVEALITVYSCLCFAQSLESPQFRVTYIGVIDCDSVATWKDDAYLACHSAGDQLPTPTDHSKHPGADAYVIRINYRSGKLAYAIRLGGSRYSAAFDIKTDEHGAAYVTGSTEAPDFPVTPDAIQRKYGGGKSDAFLAVISPEGKLRYSTFIGGSSDDDGTSLERDSHGHLYLGGTTRSPNFPGIHTSGEAGHSRAFISRIVLGGGELTSAILGGDGDTWLSGLKVDEAGALYTVGITHAPNFPVLNALQDRLRGDSDAFVSRFDAASLRLTFSSFLGGSEDDGAWGVAIVDHADPVIVGFTTSSDLPTQAQSFQKSLRGGKDVFVARIHLRGRMRAEVTYFGGTNDDAAGRECHGCSGAAITANTNAVWIGGSTASIDLPISNRSPGWDTATDAQHSFVAAFSPSLTSLCSGSYISGMEGGAIEGLTLSKRAHLLASGLSYSTDLKNALIDPHSKISLRLNGRSAHAMLISADARSVCR